MDLKSIITEMVLNTAVGITELQLLMDGNSATTWRNLNDNAVKKKQNTNNVLFMACTC